ncbi:NAD(P)-dependent oxidoreductase [Bosea sp. (in: a-proteobacteria)]|uniref:NAD(P)-dependent oxidoreductase n=1 Tax=Bosea sp. (in: a-proteobacteria) TaxID=1871050 RepID=UPI00345DA0B8|nr:NAD(P)-dependent oxidoreductase [Bosea sp. (in: a-proteobacteria)]
MARVAFIGLGAMGLRMAKRLAQADGIEVAVYDIDPARIADMPAPARRATSIADAAADADGIFSVVPADKHTRAVVTEYLEVAKPGQIFVDFSTIGPATVDEVARQLSSKGVRTIAAGMTKSLGGADNGTLSLFIGGLDQIPEVLRPAFDAIAADLMMVGSHGAAKALKLVNNMVVATLDVVMTEALTLGLQYGIAYEVLTDALQAQGGDSWTLQNHIIPHVLPDILGPGFFSTRLLMKDMKLYVEFAKSQDLPAFFAGNSLAAYRGAIAHGFSEHYHMVIARWYERAARVGERPVTALPEGLDQAAVVSRLAAGVAAVQALVTADAVRILGRMDVAPKDAAFYLESGSAGNDSLGEMVRALDGNEAKTDVRRLLADLDAVVSLAEDAAVPGAVFEIGRHTALALLDRFGPELDLWQTVKAVR